MRGFSPKYTLFRFLDSLCVVTNILLILSLGGDSDGINFCIVDVVVSFKFVGLASEFHHVRIYIHIRTGFGETGYQ